MRVLSLKEISFPLMCPGAKQGAWNQNHCQLPTLIVFMAATFSYIFMYSFIDFCLYTYENAPC